MSSFIGHSIAAITVGRALQTRADDRRAALWQFILIVAAIAPDVDYLWRPLNSANNDGARVTHSIAFCLIVSAFGFIYLFLFDRRNLARGALQICLASLSHLILDALVGSRGGDPWFYPFSTAAYSFPFGILPSSATINVTNFYFYRNLLIECGLLIPLGYLILCFAGKLKLRKTALFVLVPVFAACLVWSIGLNR
jgi:inner membrane protein